jgi:hypothetical protein
MPLESQRPENHIPSKPPTPILENLVSRENLPPWKNSENPKLAKSATVKTSSPPETLHP